ncbi:MAG: hypothetical protein QNI92_12580 [Desulfobacterales bacterium]|nr:hypothetical protein [Desulfobacterales bacterium]MDJ0912568.1 hypothetical protein [Desulfobacterales bacterium]
MLIKADNGAKVEIANGGYIFHEDCSERVTLRDWEDLSRSDREYFSEATAKLEAIFKGVRERLA